MLCNGHACPEPSKLCIIETKSSASRDELITEASCQGKNGFKKVFEDKQKSPDKNETFLFKSFGDIKGTFQGFWNQFWRPIVVKVFPIKHFNKVSEAQHLWKSFLLSKICVRASLCQIQLCGQNICG